MSKELNNEYVRKDLYQKDTDIIATEINDLNARLDDIKATVGWGLSLLGLAFLVAQVAIGYLLYVISITPK